MKVDLNDPNTTDTSTPSPGADNAIVQAWFKPRKDVTWRLMMSSSILHHHVVMPARHWNKLFVPLRKCCAKMFDHETMQPFRWKIVPLNQIPWMAGSNPPIFQVFQNFWVRQIIPVRLQEFWDWHPAGLGGFGWILRVPHFEMLKKPPNLSSLAYSSSSVFAGDERMTQKKTNKNHKKTCWGPKKFRNHPPGTFRTTFSFTSRAGSCWEKSS